MAALRVLIVGAGIAGLGLALAHHQQGITAEVVERSVEWQPIGAGLYLPGNAVRALHQLGIELVADGANPIGHQRFIDHRGRLLADIELEQTHPRDRTRNLVPLVRNVTLRLAAERIYRSNYGPLRDMP